MNFCQITLIGHVGRDAIQKEYSGKKVTSFSLAVSRNRKGADGEWTSTTTWYEIAAFGPIGDTLMPLALKGENMLVIGRLEARQYVKKDGSNATSLDVVVDKAMPLERKKTGESTPTQSGADLESLPF
jgi:single-strand DNA-binding protein